MNIRRARLAANLTQEGLAEMADIHWKTLGYIEAGKRDFGVTILTRLVLCLDVTGDELWKGAESNPTNQSRLVAKATTRKRKA